MLDVRYRYTCVSVHVYVCVCVCVCAFVCVCVYIYIYGVYTMSTELLSCGEPHQSLVVFRWLQRTCSASRMTPAGNSWEAPNKELQQTQQK